MEMMNGATQNGGVGSRSPLAPISGDVLVQELTDRMETVALPRQDETTPAAAIEPSRRTVLPPRTTNLAAIDPQRRRPWDNVRDTGAPADPVPFDRHRMHRGRRGQVCCYDPHTGRDAVLANVLFRDYGYDDDDENRLGREQQASSSVRAMQRAYYPMPGKARIKTIMGHVEICIVLERCFTDYDEESLDGTSQNSLAEDDEIVFQLTTHLVAVKVNYDDRMKQLRHKHAEDPLKEIAAMQLVGDTHPHVLGCDEVLFDGQNLNVIMKYCDQGDLFQLLQQPSSYDDDDDDDDQTKPPGMSEGRARYWFRQIMSGVQHLHRVGVCHRDLSPENVLIDGNRSVIIDMGMCLRVPYTNTAARNGNPQHRTTDIVHGQHKLLFKPQGACGKLPYMSPEIYRNQQPFDGEAADVWTAGTILFCMLTGNRSYQRPHSTDAQFYWMTHGLSQLLADWHVALSPAGLHLLQNMLQVEPRLRLTLDEIVQHPWFDGPDDSVE